MRSIILAAILLSGCTPTPQPIFTESTGLMDSTRDTHAACEHLLIQAGKVQAEVDPRALWDWCMVRVGAAI